MIRREPLDHDMIIDRGMRIHIVFGSTHPPGRVFTYVKYIPEDRGHVQSMWKLMRIPMRRVVERYSVSHIERSFRSYQETSWDPVFGAEMPSIGYLEVLTHLLPDERGYEVYTRPRDRLEAIASELIEAVGSAAGVPLGSIGVGGSLLGSFHNVVRSDIDLIVYGCENASKVYDKAGEVGETLSGKTLERWAENLSRLHGVSIEVARAMYSPYRRIIFRGVEATFVFPEERRRYGEEVVLSTSTCVEALLEVEGGQCTALQYPARARVERVIEVSRGIGRVEGLILYEGTYSPILYRGGVLRVAGLAQLVLPRGVYRIAVGTRECGGYVLPSQPAL